MSDHELGFFLIADEHMPEIRALWAAVAASRDAGDPDLLYRHTTMFLRAGRLAITHAVRFGEHDAELGCIHEWIQAQCPDIEDVHIVGPEHVRTLHARIGEFDVAALARSRRIRRRHGKINAVTLGSLFEGLQRVVGASCERPGTLVTGRYHEEHREPPDLVVFERPGPVISDEDQACREQYKKRHRRDSLARNQSGWVTLRQDRMLLGLLPAEDGQGWRDAYEQARAPFQEYRYIEAITRCQEYVRKLESALQHAHIVSVAGAATAQIWLRIKFKSNPNRLGDICDFYPPERLAALSQRIDEVVAENGGEDGLIDAVYRMEDWWTRDFARAAYAQVRALVQRAMDTGSWFVWFYDKYGNKK